MNDWTDGYIAEVSYTVGYYREQSPWMMYYTVLAQGFRPPKLDDGFKYCELGSGHGFTTNVHATGNPNGQFYCTDFNPGHTASAREMAAAGGVDNVKFYDMSFADFGQVDLPEFDMISLHGIYSWVSKQNREIIVDFCRDKLRVGGAVYISYNTQPGWASIMPVRDMMNQYAASSTEPLHTKVDKALAFIDELIANKAGYFAKNPGIEAYLQRLKEMPRNYVAHEFFNHEWWPLFFKDVAQELDGAKLSFVGSSFFPDNFDFYGQEIVNSVGDPNLKESIRDFLRNQMFRKDIYVRGPVRISEHEQRELLDQLRFSLVVHRQAVKLDIQLGMYSYNLQPEIYNPIVDALNEGPKTMGELASDPALENVTYAQLHQALQLMTGIGYIMPGPPTTTDAAKEKCEKFNRAVADRARMGNDCPAVISPSTGAGVMLDRISHLVLEALRQDTDPAEFVCDIVFSQGQRFVRNGQQLESREENVKQVQELVNQFREITLPTLNRCGIEVKDAVPASASS